MAGAMTTYAERYGVAAGKQVAIFTSGSAGYRAARTLAAKGVAIAAIVDARAEATDQAPDGIRVIRSASIVDTKGRQRLKGVVVERSGYEELIACDALGMSGGWSAIGSAWWCRSCSGPWPPPNNLTPGENTNASLDHGKGVFILVHRSQAGISVWRDPFSYLERLPEGPGAGAKAGPASAGLRNRSPPGG